MDIPISDLTADDLSFRGEGEEHIVLRIKNSLNVIRLRKIKVGSSMLMTELIERAQRDIIFLCKVARPAYGPLITDHASLVRLSSATVQELHEKIKHHRKGMRMHKEINNYGIGCLCPDAALHYIQRTTSLVENQNGSYTSKTEEQSMEKNSFILANENAMKPHREKQSPYIQEISLTPFSNSRTENLTGCTEKNSSYMNADLLCIEIKPKSGIIDFSVPNNSFCKFCIKNFLKVEKGNETTRSLYCPLDLFSGKKNLMQKAVDGLFITPQNNLNVFKWGPNIETSLQTGHNFSPRWQKVKCQYR
ncbi:unnamed protein product [Meganyctiphanes norvegica]|uniref:Inositol-pentakisphosphate 2-kinase n=1 Tax=Meganyctiphanes norvegica TaxID=48144 RepID=A0AAV2Q277_MEGNR